MNKRSTGTTDTPVNYHRVKINTQVQSTSFGETVITVNTPELIVINTELKMTCCCQQRSLLITRVVVALPRTYIFSGSTHLTGDGRTLNTIGNEVLITVSRCESNCTFLIC